MPRGRPSGSAYRSHRLIYDALISGPKYFQELHQITRLHRNTLANRLTFLVSRGLIQRARKGRRVYYQIVEPFRDEEGRIRDEGRNWSTILLKWGREERRALVKQLKSMLWQRMGNEQQLNEAYQSIADNESGFDRLLSLPESSEILNLLENWRAEPIPKLWLILALNKCIVNLNSVKSICPECHHFGTIADSENQEVICPSCGLVIGDEVISQHERMDMILEFLELPSDQDTS